MNLSIFEWETEVYPKMHKEATEAGAKAKLDGLPRECNLTDPKFLHKGKPLRLWEKIWYQGWDGWKIPEEFRRMEEVINRLPLRPI